MVGYICVRYYITVGYTVPISGNLSGRLAMKSSSGSTDTLSVSMEGVIFGIGDPLLDIIADVPISFLEKYSLIADRGYLLSDDLKQLPADLQSGSFEIHRVPGGSELNCFKMVQHLIGVPKAATFLGSIGRDANGDFLEQAMTSTGINAIFQRHPTEPTGVCYICVTDVHRTMVTNLGAARSLKANALDDPKVWRLVEKAKYFYAEAYSMSNRSDQAMKLAEHALKHNKIFAMNLSSVYLCKKYADKIVALLPYVDLLFGSDVEATAFAESKNFLAKDVEEIAVNLARSPKANGRRGRLVVLTRGMKPAIAVDNGRLRSFPVIPIETEHIRDTVGAGDTFVGGYLAALILGSEHEERMDSGINAAHYVIRQRGCSFDFS